ncbi:hypothetical protein THOM_2852 [Trachipleistophora hominis]|uniref:Uncharacterized protein n=1 Tax=Trachipleistophora hominis TaxID=72359 RepID=L7JSH5_TRAHO|nr:hypothetical protein THOM_2852 [Trachipleistophora hominis]
MDLDPLTALGMPDEEMMNVRIDGIADRSDWLEAALQSYMMAGGEKGGVNALELAAKTYFNQSGRTDTIGLNMVDELELAAKAYLRKNGMIDTSKMNGTDVMATLAHVHPFARKFQGARNKAVQGMPGMRMTSNQLFPTTIDSFGNPYNSSIQHLDDPFGSISVLTRLDLLKMYLNGAPGYNTPSPLRHTSYSITTHRPSWRM